MSRIILIETSTALCSAALAEDGKILSYRENANRQHASLLAPMIKEVLDDHGLTVHDCDAVCVSMGPGSFTGLRVGSSTAKGLCFGADKPLLAVGSLDTLVWQAIGGGIDSDGSEIPSLLPEGCRHIIPMIDARRMEVYSAVFTPDGRQITETKPEVIDAQSYSDYLADGTVLFTGDGAAKCSTIISSPNARFLTASPSARGMLLPAFAALAAGDVRDTAYFEPFYLKDFIATVSKKKLF